MAVNENNYEGANVTIVGRAGSEARNPAYDKDGTRGILEVGVAVSQGYKKDGEWVPTGTTWYTYTASGDHADTLRTVKKGDKVRIDDARLETREFERGDGSKGQAFEVRFGAFKILESKTSGPAPVGDDTPF
jgi:single-stranded DNA-binding protein